MGYRSAVRSLIYGDPELVDALVAKHQLLGGKIFEQFGDSLRVYTIKRHMYDAEATMAQEPNADGGRAVIHSDVLTRVIDLSGSDWKWYEDYADVRAWHALLDEARDEWELNTEFVRIGEDTGDIVVEGEILDDGDNLIFVSRSIEDDMSDEVGPDGEPLEETPHG